MKECSFKLYAAIAQSTGVTVITQFAAHDRCQISDFVEQNPANTKKWLKRRIVSLLMRDRAQTAKQLQTSLEASENVKLNYHFVWQTANEVNVA